MPGLLKDVYTLAHGLETLSGCKATMGRGEGSVPGRGNSGAGFRVLQMCRPVEGG